MCFSENLYDIQDMCIRKINLTADKPSARLTLSMIGLARKRNDVTVTKKAPP